MLLKTIRNMFSLLVVLMLVSKHVCDAAPGFSTNKFKPDLVVDLFELGTEIFDIWKGSTDDTKGLIEEVSTKIDAVLGSITNLKETVSDLFAQQALQARLAVVEHFHRQTLNRIRELDDIVNAKNTEKENYMQLFIDGTKGSYLDALYDIIPNLIGKSISSDKTLLELIREHKKCDSTALGQFADFCRTMIYSGIIVEVTFKMHEYNLTLEKENKEWDKKLQDFESNVEIMGEYCGKFFSMYYDEDIQQEKGLPQLHAELERRYANISFFEVDVSDDDVFLIGEGTPREHLKCFKPCIGSGRRCFTYTKAGTPCKQNPSLQIVTSDKDLQYRMSSDWPGTIFFTVKDRKRTYNLLQVDCSVSPSFVPYTDVETKTCADFKEKASAACIHGLSISTALFVFASAMLQ